MTQEPADLIRTAIENKKPISFTYTSKSGAKEHTVCPYILGTRKGTLQVRSVKLEGPSYKELIPGGDNWRCWFVAKMSNVIVLEAGWSVASNHSLDEFSDILAAVPIISEATDEVP